MSTPRYIGTKEAAEMLGVSHDTITRLCREGRIAGAWFTEGNHLRMTRRAVENYRNRQAVAKRVK